MTSLIKFALLQKYKMGVNVSLQKKKIFFGAGRYMSGEV